MFTLTLTEDQFKYLFGLLDNELKLRGLDSLVPAVDLYNVLMTAKAAGPTEAQEFSEKPETDTDQPLTESD